MQPPTVVKAAAKPEMQPDPATNTMFVSYLAAAIVLTVAGVAGGEWFMQCDYITYGLVKSSWTESAGYNGAQFFGLVLQTLCLPSAAICLMTFVLQSYRSRTWHQIALIAVYLLVLFLLVLGACLSVARYSDGVLTCLWDMCLTSTYSSTSSKSAFITTVGVMYFITCIAYILLLMVVTVRVYMRLATSGSGSAGVAGEGEAVGDTVLGVESSHPSKDAASRAHRYQPLVDPEGQEVALSGSNSHLTGAALARFNANRGKEALLRRRFLLCMSFLVFLPLCIFVSMSVGDTWEYLTVAKLQSYATSWVDDDYGEVFDINVGDGSVLVLKLFPDILMFWLVGYVVVIAALAGLAFQQVRLFYNARPRVLGGLSCGQFLMGSTFVGLLLGECLYWYLEHAWHNKALTSKTWEERLTRTLGQLANATMGLMVVPVTRNSIFQTVFGVPWEAMVAYHRVMGWTFLTLIAAHQFLWWKVWAQQEDFSHDWPIAIPMDYNADNWTVPLAIMTFWVMLITNGLLAWEKVRRAAFEVFYYAHHFFLVVWVVMLWHAASAWYYIIPAIALWAFDRAIRHTKALSHVTVLELEVTGEVTKIGYVLEAGGKGPWGGGAAAKETPLVHAVGQYAFINVPALSTFEWHPFTFSSSPADNVTEHHILSMGPGTFTERLQKLATGMQVASERPERLLINVDGPYGLPLPYQRYRRIVFVAGGIGVTPSHSCYRYLYHLAAAGELQGCLEDGAHLIWAARHAWEFTLFADTLQQTLSNSQNGRFSLALHMTSGFSSFHGQFQTALGALPYRVGRPDLRKELEPLRSLGTSALVFVCGPETMRDQVAKITQELGVSCHQETFLL